MENKLDAFKEFVRTNPFLIGYIRSGKKSWQDFYEMYDLYGEDEDAWANFLKEEKVEEKENSQRGNSGGYLDDLMMAVNIFSNSLQSFTIDSNSVSESVSVAHISRSQ